MTGAVAGNRSVMPYCAFVEGNPTVKHETANTNTMGNLFDKQPERTFPDATNTATGQTNANFYDILGRRYYVGMRLQF